MAVEPLLLPDWHLLANVEEEYNAVYLRYRAAGDLSLFGKGAGGLPTATAVLGDIIDLAQDNSARWPVPKPMTLTSNEGRRHYLRVSAQPHAGLGRRVESLLRRASLGVQNRAERREGEGLHLAFLVAASTDEALERALAPIRRLGRVGQILVLGVTE
jgi:homoserine dehydrogenase